MIMTASVMGTSLGVKILNDAKFSLETRSSDAEFSDRLAAAFHRLPGAFVDVETGSATMAERRFGPKLAVDRQCSFSLKFLSATSKAGSQMVLQ